MSEQNIEAGGGHTWGISWTKVCPVDGPINSKVTYDKMSSSCGFIFRLLLYSPLRDFETFAYDAICLFVMILNLLVNRLKRMFNQVCIMC